MTERIALFPLRTVLFPEGVLPLRIFETRYLDMVRRCMREQSGFGVVLIHAGDEVGAIGELAGVGTFARVVDFGQLPDGLLSIVARGEKRFRIHHHELQKDGLHLGDVEWLADASDSLEISEFTELRAMLAQVLDELGDAYSCGEQKMDDALWVSGQLGQLLPVSTGFRQRLLETDSARERLELLDAARSSET